MPCCCGGTCALEDRVLRLTLDIVRGLDAAWNAGLMHRDIKPANVLLSPDGIAKIVDFGPVPAS